MSSAATLAAKYRPKTFGDLVGQKLNAVILQRMVDKDAVPPGLVFSGPSGVGKTTAARILAVALGGEVIEVDAASHGSVDAVRRMTETLRYSMGEDHRVVIYDEAHSMSREAFNALLITLEEPPTGTVFVFVTSEPEKIPETIMTRTLQFEFHRITAEVILDRLVTVAEAEEISVETELLKHIADHAGGNLRSALGALERCAIAEIAKLDTYLRVEGVKDGGPALLAALVTGDPAHFYGVLDQQLARVGSPSHIANQLLGTLRDISVLKAGGTIRVRGAALDALHELARRIDQERLFAITKLIWDLRTRVRGADDPLRNLEMSLMLIAELLTRGARPSQPAAPAAETRPEPSVAPKRMTLSDIQRRR